MSTKKNNRFKNLIDKIPAEILIFLLAVIYRLPTLGRDLINNDAYLWKERGYEFGSALMSLKFVDTAVTYHPGVPLLYNLFISNKIYSLLNAILYKGLLSSNQEFIVNHTLQKVIMVFFTAFLITIVFNLLKRIIGEKLSILVTIVVLLEPFFIGLSREIHTDAIQSLFMIISILSFYIGTYLASSAVSTWKANLKWFLIAGFFAGLSALTKSSGLFLLGFYLLWVLYIFYKTKNSICFKRFLITVGCALLTFFVLWPAMWVAPVTTLSFYLLQGVKGVALEEGHGHIWFGKETLNPGIAFYPIAIAARYSEVVVLLAIGGIFYYFKKFKKLDSNTRNFIGVILSFTLLYFLMLTFVSKKLDRYSLPLLYPLVIIAVYYLPKVFAKRTIAIGLIVLVIIRGILIVAIHPNYFAYYSLLVGGMDHGRYVIEPKWLVGYDKVANYFNSMDNNKNIKVAIADYDYLRPLAKFEVLNIKHESERDKAKYFVLPVYRKERNDYYKQNYNLDLVGKIKIASHEYYEIYRVVSKN